MPQSASDKALMDRIENDFTYHAPKGDQAAHYARIRERAKELAITIATLCPDGPERSLAITHARMAMMWANAGIACAE